MIYGLGGGPPCEAAPACPCCEELCLSGYDRMVELGGGWAPPNCACGPVDPLHRGSTGDDGNLGVRRPERDLCCFSTVGLR